MQILLVIGLLVAIFILTKALLVVIEKVATNKAVSRQRLYYIHRFVTVIGIFLALIAVALVLSFDFSGLLVFTSSVFAVVGVALFAQWSILSNATASLLIFFNFPARVQDSIKIIDGDNSVEGKIIEIQLFNTLIKDNQGDIIIYPNSLLLQKPVVKISKE